MKMINPLTVTDAMLTSSTAPETDYSAWSSATTYNTGDHCIRTETHRIYESLIDSNTNNMPEDNLIGTTPAWLDIGPTNRWAMFDNVVGTSTDTASPLTVVINPGQGIGGVALMELVGDQVDIVLKDSSGGTTIYSATLTLDGTSISSWYDWFFEPYEQLTDMVLTDLPHHYTTPELTITLSGSGTVSCGVCKFGSVLTIGDTQWGVNVGITDYSKKDTDPFGNIGIVERSYAKREEFKIECEPGDFNKIFRALASVRAIACIWIGSEQPNHLPMIVYGFYRDFSIDVAYLKRHYCTLEIEGLI